VASVYSKRLYEGRNVSSGALVVPPGVVWVVRDIDAFFGGGVSGGALNVTGTLGQTFAYFPYTGLVSSSFEWRGRQIFDAGDAWGFVSGAGVDLTISGYELSLP